MKHACGDRHAQRIVDEREEQILSDVLHDVLGETPCTDDASEVALHQRHVGALNRNVGTGAHRDAYVGSRKSRRVVRAVASHRDAPTGRLQLCDELFLLLG